MKKALLIIMAIGIMAITAQGAFCDEQVYVLDKGHSIKVDKNIMDWVGLPPLKDNTAAIDKGELIWKDAKGDDTGPGSYVYPLDRKIQKGADIREVRITYDEQKLYLMIKCDRPNDWWVPYRVIGIDTDNGKSGMKTLAQGSIDEYDTYNGTYCEVGLDDSLACNYVVGISSTYKGRIWDSSGNLISYIEGDEKTVPGFKVADANWYAMEISLPYDIIGDPRGETWKFIIGVCTQDNDVAREVFEEADEWHGGGSDDMTMADDGVDPDLYDLAGADKEGQIADFSSYNANAAPGDENGFCKIKNSYIAVTFTK